MQLRDAHWLHVGAVGSSEGVAAPAKVPPVPFTEPPGRPSKFQLMKPVNGRKVARVMRDGTRLCELWQTGQCKKGKGCPDAHRCGVVTNAKDRVCGSNRHGASTCTMKSKA